MHILLKPDPDYEVEATLYYGNTLVQKYSGDVGFDLYCLEDVDIPAHTIGMKVSLRVSVEAIESGKPTGFYLFPRSSTGLKTPIRLSNSVGVIDPGWRGPISVIIDNISSVPFTMYRGERYFQICSPTLTPVTFEIVKELSPAERNTAGFGSTGK